MVLDSEYTMTKLMEEIKRRADRAGSLRALSIQSDVSYSGLKNLRDNPEAQPELETLVKLARAFKLPLWKIVEMAGFDLELSHGDLSQVQRLASLVEAMPEYRPIVDELLNLGPDDIEGMLIFLETIQRRRAVA